MCLVFIVRIFRMVEKQYFVTISLATAFLMAGGCLYFSWSRKNDWESFFLAKTTFWNNLILAYKKRGH